MNRFLTPGVVAALAAYGMWGMFPLLFRLVREIDPGTIVAHRILWSVVFVGIGLAVVKRLGEVWTAMRDRHTLRGIGAAALLLCVNWLLFIWAVNNNQVLATSFGYFINPLVNVGIGVLLLKEKLNNVQKGAIALAVIAVVIQAIAIGQLPWIALTLAFTFGFYGYFRKTVNVGSAPGLLIEVILLAPLSILYLMFEHSTLPLPDAGTIAILAALGAATAAPLLCFAFAAKKLPMTTLGMFQYLAPSLTFLTAVFIFGEPMNMVQLGSFALIWVSLAIFTADSIRRRRTDTVTPPELD